MCNQPGTGGIMSYRPLLKNDKEIGRVDISDYAYADISGRYSAPELRRIADLVDAENNETTGTDNDVNVGDAVM